MIGIGTGFEDLSEERSYSLSNYTKGALLYMVCAKVSCAYLLPAFDAGSFYVTAFRTRILLALPGSYPVSFRVGFMLL